MPVLGGWIAAIFLVEGTRDDGRCREHTGKLPTPSGVISEVVL
jgi:hypothetical protein